MAKSPLSNTKQGGVRIPYERLGDLPKLKYNELIAIHKDGSVRYFVNESHTDAIATHGVVAVIYNGVSGVSLPQLIVNRAFGFNSTFLKPLFAIRALLPRYSTKRSFYYVSLYDSKNASRTFVGLFKTPFAVELGLRAAL